MCKIKFKLIGCVLQVRFFRISENGYLTDFQIDAACEPKKLACCNTAQNVHKYVFLMTM